MRLESWKEIAVHLHRTVRTAQRWERDEGLPVHRQAHERRDSVYAISSELDSWLEERKRTAKQAAPVAAPVAPRRRLLPATVCAMLLAAAGIGAYSWISSRPAVPFAARDWAVLADFDNQTGDSNLDHGLGLAFRVSLQQSRHANLLPDSQVENALRLMGESPDRKLSPAVAREVAIREGAKAVVLPGISRIGGLYAISARLIDVKTGEVVAAYMDRAGGQDGLLEALGKLAARVRRGLGESLASIHKNDRPLPQVTTPSLEGLRAFAEGSTAWRRGNYSRGMELYAAALNHDPDFAMAHAAVGTAFLSHVYNQLEQGKPHFERARQLGARVTARERLIIEAHYHAGLGHVQQASESYRAYLASYPDDADARAGLAYFLMRNGRSEEAIVQYRVVLRTFPGDSSHLINLAAAYKSLNRPAEAIPYYEKAFALEKTWLKIFNINHEYGFALAMTGNTAKAHELFSLAAADAPTRVGGLRSLALLSMLEGKYRNAASQLKEAIDGVEANHQDLSGTRNRLFLAIVSFGRGDRVGAIAELDRAAIKLGKAKDAGIWLPARVAMMYARAGAIEKAARFRDVLLPRADPNSAPDQSELRLLEGEIALAKGEHGRAVLAMEAARHDQQWPLTLAGLARSYDAAGRNDEAVGLYEQLISNLDSAAGWEPQQDALEACARAAEIYLQRNSREKALVASQRLVSLWGEAESDLPLAARIGRLRAAMR